MKRLFATATATLMLSSALSLGVVHAAEAAAYPPSDSIVASSATIDAGATVHVSAKAATFTGGEHLTITVTGENGHHVSYALVRLESSSATYRDARATSDGGLAPLAVTFPSEASGIYTIAVFSSSSPGGTVTVTVGGVAATGANAMNMVGIWFGGGALVLAGAVIAVTAAVRRAKERADS